MHNCKSIGCITQIISGSDFCSDCQTSIDTKQTQDCFDFDSPKPSHDLDVYAVHHMFQIHDYSGCIQQASTKLLMSCDNPTNKPLAEDISEARDILNRWLELNGWLDRNRSDD